MKFHSLYFALNYILNAVLSFVLILIGLFFFVREQYLISVVVALGVLIYLLFSDIYFPSVGNIRKFIFTKKNIRKKILLRLLNLSLYIAIFFIAGLSSVYILILIDLFIGLDIIFLVIKRRTFLFYLFDV